MSFISRVEVCAAMGNQVGLACQRWDPVLHSEIAECKYATCSYQYAMLGAQWKIETSCCLYTISHKRCNEGGLDTMSTISI